jgi:hypothetical protein
VTAAKYMYIGAITLAASGATAFYLNFQGVRCLSELAQVDRTIFSAERLEEMERNCSIITNSYVFSVYGIIVGVILIVIGLVKKREDIHAS